jgi:hypothetical protein
MEQCDKDDQYTLMFKNIMCKWYFVETFQILQYFNATDFLQPIHKMADKHNEEVLLNRTSPEAHR